MIFYFNLHVKLLVLLILFHYNLKSFIPIKFNESMGHDTVEFKHKYTNSEILPFLRQLYEKHSLNTSNKKLRIPKIIHQIWVGPKPIPESYKIFQQTWKKFHPTWKYKFWTDKEVKYLPLINQELYNKTTDYREKADILRYELLEKFGGLYVDMDFECLKPFDKLNYHYDFYTGISSNNVREVVNNALIACCPNHPLIKKIVRNIENKDVKDWKSRSGVFYFSKQFCELIKASPGINVALPKSFFYAIPYKFNQKISIRPLIKEETMGLHYWGTTSGTTLNLIRKVNVDLLGSNNNEFLNN